MNVNIENDYMPIHGKNLSEAWAQAFIKCWNAKGRVLAPGIIHFNACNSGEEENIKIRSILEKQFKELNLLPTSRTPLDTVANTIFPESIWQLSNGDRNKFYALYKRIWPRVKKCHANRNGVYFRRLTSFGKNEVNQLECILAAWQKNIHRHSALQASLFDPEQDHSLTLQRGFPCLQQVIFHPNGANGKDGLSVVALYANQLLLEKAYGNYLGLHRLGKFMAGEMGIIFKDVLCIASNLKISNDYDTKKENSALVDALTKELQYDK